MTGWDRIDREVQEGPRLAWVGWFIGAVVALGVVFAVLGFIGGWFDKAAEVVGPENVSEQYHDVAKDWQAMQAAAANACAVGDPTSEEGDPVLVENPALAYEATFRNIAGDYNRRMTNIFEAGIVAPEGYPETVDMPSGDVDWCGVAEAMASIP